MDPISYISQAAGVFQCLGRSSEWAATFAEFTDVAITCMSGARRHTHQGSLGKSENLSVCLHSSNKWTGLDRSKLCPWTENTTKNWQKPKLTSLPFAFYIVCKENIFPKACTIRFLPKWWMPLGWFLWDSLVYQLLISSLSLCTIFSGLPVLDQFVSLNMMLWCPYITTQELHQLYPPDSGWIQKPVIGSKTSFNWEN